MIDTATLSDIPNSRGDWHLIGPALQIGNDLTTAMLISLFTDRQARDDDVIPDGSDDPRGWWSDTDPLYPIGSRLWLLDQSKQTQEVLARAHDYIVEAVQWMLDDGVLAFFDITIE